MKSFVKQILAISLALILVLSLVPSAVAEENLRNADNTEQEYTRHGLGRLPARPHDTPKSPDDLSNVQESNGTSASDLPEKYDSRDLGCITPVRDQGNHNTCWTFGALASCEAYMIKHGVNVGDSGQKADLTLDLSEYHLAYYTYTDAYDAEGMLDGDKTYFLSSHSNRSFLEAGGTGELASYPLMRWTGLADETEEKLKYEYANSEGLGEEHAYQNNVAHVTSVKHFFGSNVDEVKRHIMEYGAGSLTFLPQNASGSDFDFR